MSPLRDGPLKEIQPAVLACGSGELRSLVEVLANLPYCSGTAEESSSCIDGTCCAATTILDCYCEID